MSEELKDPMNLTVGEYFKIKAEMEAEVLKTLQTLVGKYKAKLGMTPSWIEIDHRSIQGIGEARRQFVIEKVICHFPIA